RQDDSLRFKDDELSGLALVAERADDAVAVLEQAGESDFHVDVHADADGLILEGANELQAGTIADVVKAAVLMASERALGDQAFRGPVEDRAVLLQFQHTLGSLFGEDLGGAPVVEESAPLHRIREMDLPAIALFFPRGRGHV